jgi:Transport and Golgi organisation 2
MCTVSFIPNANGFYLGMNRDESRLRPIALEPRVQRTNHGISIYPSEPSGGTWIALNDSGLCLALINWHKAPRRLMDRIVSRGIVVKELIKSQTVEDMCNLLRDLPIEAMPPFRLMAISLRESVIREFRWDQKRVVTVGHRWIAGHWFSSGVDERRAELTRAAVCCRKWKEPDAGELAWLRRLHRCHLPVRGGFSICMHREDACTVSYTEVEFREVRGTMRYHPASLCSGNGRQFFEKTLSLTP